MRQLRTGHRRHEGSRLSRGAAWIALASAAALLFGIPARSYPQLERRPEQGGRVESLGQPPQTLWYAGFAGGAFLAPDRPHELTFDGYVGAARPLFNPVAGLATLGVELYGGARGVRSDGGARLILRVPYIGLGAGIDYNLREDEAVALITAYGPVRRGGIVVPGGLLRIDVHPQHRRFAVGVSLPLAQRFSGRGRPLREHIQVGAEFQPRVRYRLQEPALEAVLDSVSASAEWIRRLVVPFLDQDGRTAAIAQQRTARSVQELRGHLARRSAVEEVRHFHAQVERAFVLAAGENEVARALAAQAREVILAEILLPYNRLLGRKKRRDTLEDLAIAARGRFSRAVTASGLVPPARADHVDYTFQRVTQILDDVRRTASREWNDARLAWLPLQYALLPEDHDEQQELDALLARATEVPFSRGNDIRYVANLQFHHELLRSIGETEDYHVLWVHDFPALNPDGALDSASVAIMEGYLTALAERVEAYDATGTLPSYFIFLDEFYYQARRSRALMDILEDPLRVRPDLPNAPRSAHERLDRLLARLRTAALQSRVLQAEVRHYGDAWLRNRIKVHVSITNRSDPSFWGGALFGTWFSYPDNVMRDHRKIAFRDVSETDPERGLAILTGMGVGDQYVDPGWEDRSLVVAGPILVGLKRAARDLLVSQGLQDRLVPVPLREVPRYEDGSALAAVADAAPVPRSESANLRDTDALLLANGTGYLPKPINVAKALLYSLLPPGSVMKIPDSLWNSTFFGGLLAGASLRGCTVSIIAPAVPNAPSGGFPQMARAHELLSRLLLVRDTLAEAINAAAGELHIGLYALDPDRNGFASRTETWVRQVSAARESRALGPARTHLLATVSAAAGPARTAPAAAAGQAPKLHHKVQYLATPQTWDALMRSDAWPEFMSAYLRYREATYHLPDGGGSEVAQAFPVELARIARRLHGPLDAVTHAASYALVGSQNMDYRGMFMDGEVVVLYAGAAALVPLLDMVFLEGNTTWIEDQPSLERLLPRPSELQRRIARVMKDAL